MVESGFYTFGVVGDLRPKITCIQYPTFLQENPKEWDLVFSSGNSLGEKGGCLGLSGYNSGVLDYGEIVCENSETVSSDTIVFVFRPKYSATSGVWNEAQIFNMKLWVDDYGDMSGINPYIQMLATSGWYQNVDIGSGEMGAIEIPYVLPSGQNIYRKDGHYALVGTSNSQITQNIYSNIILSSGLYDIGIKNFRLRFTYDWTASSANVASGDF